MGTVRPTRAGRRRRTPHEPEQVALAGLFNAVLLGHLAHRLGMPEPRPEA